MQKRTRKSKPKAKVHKLPRALDRLARQINAEHALVEKAQGDVTRATRHGLEHARRAGVWLIEAKKQVGHGKWLSWLKEHCGVSERTSQMYTMVARNWERLNDKSGTRCGFALRNVWQLLQDAARAEGAEEGGADEGEKPGRALDAYRSACNRFAKAVNTAGQNAQRLQKKQIVEWHNDLRTQFQKLEEEVNH